MQLHVINKNTFEATLSLMIKYPPKEKKKEKNNE